ncbi:DUF4335 domain-containing protein [Nostocaceae cyanobacterium CENA357]|uniref:DUF4335 domain-containing protein n=1 Tax=Atlanticothrix silvestris CENA357 TaxID=1725252 RepID=A0A8J7H9L6_9CYAN|nr:DUF4335 domain-containing protein [Atlanticothrix silvestris]MBH8552758.1 DUF4335 domain-containing protein [Atlanticothrix silvestris CENA357]
MPPSNSVIRRYTPPTCTLEILAQSSPLSQWMGKTVLKQLSFELRFDDPRLPEERRVPIRGDRDQLEALCDAVTSYIQEILQQSSENFWVSFSGNEDSSKVPHDSELTDFQQPSLPTQTFQSFSSQIPGIKIHLEPGKYLTHNLFLGSLANQGSGPVIQLSLLQLFDLATALDEYSADVMALPSLNKTTPIRRLPAWTPVAAVLVLSVGLLPMTLQYANNTRQKQPSTAKKTTSANEELALAPPLNLPTPQPGITPPDSLQPLPPLGSTPPLPTDSLPQTPLAPPDSSLTSTLPPTSPLSPQDTLTIPQGTIPTQNSNQQNPAFATGNQQIAIQPNLKQNSTRSISQSEIGLPKKRDLPPSLSSTTGSLSPNISAVPPAVPTLPSAYTPFDPKQLEEKINSSGTVASRSQPSSELSPTSNTSSAVADSDSLVNRLRGQSPNPTSTEVATDSTLFDTPQIAEARDILKSRWQPPTGLTQTLEYSLMVGVDGTIERIFPLNKPAREFVNSTGMPDIGKPFVSANRYGKNLRIRVILSPNGKVQTLPESD